MIEYLYKALESEFGIEVETDQGDIDLLIQRLYKAKAKLTHPRTSQIKLLRSRHEPFLRVWICIEPEENHAQEARPADGQGPDPNL